MIKQLRHRAWGVLVLDAGNTKTPFQTQTLVRALKDAGRAGASGAAGRRRGSGAVPPARG